MAGDFGSSVDNFLKAYGGSALQQAPAPGAAPPPVQQQAPDAPATVPQGQQVPAAPQPQAPAQPQGQDPSAPATQQPAAQPPMQAQPQAPQSDFSRQANSLIGSLGLDTPATPAQDPNRPGASPQNPLNVSPVSFMDRLKMSVGNDAGSIKYLKKQYQDVQYNPDKGIVVKDNDGQWKQMDPSGWGGGDAWDKTKEVAKDLLADSPGVLINAAGTTGKALSLIGAPESGGASLLGIAATGAATGAIRTSLGRLAGTYEATPADQLKDIGLEALLNAGGQAVALGAKPVTSKIIDAVKSFASTASDGAKAAMVPLLASTTGAAPQNVARLMSDAPAVMGELSKASQDAAAHEVPSNLTSNAMNYAKGLLQGVGKAMGRKFDGMESDLLQAVPATFKADMSQAAHEAMSTMTQNGLLNPIADKAGNVVGYKMAPLGDIQKLFQGEGMSGPMVQKATQKLEEFRSMASGFLGKAPVEGADGADALMQMRRGFDKFYFAATRANPDMKELLTPASSAMRQSLVSQLQAASPEVATKYTAMNEAWKDAMPWIAKADRIARTPNGLQTFVTQLQAGKDVVAKGVLQRAMDLKGDAGQKLGNMVQNANAAQDFISKWPQIASLKNAAIGAGAAVGGSAAHVLGPAGAMLGLGAAAATAPLTSPRLVGAAASGAQKLLPYATQLGDFLKQIPASQMKQFIADPNMFSDAVTHTVMGAHAQGQMTQQLLQSHGIPAGGQPNASQQ